MKKIVSLLFVTLLAYVATGCATKQYLIVKGWEGPSMEDMAPDKKMPRSQLPPKEVPNVSYTYDDGAGYSYSHSRGESLSVNRSWDPHSGPRFHVNRSTHNNTQESFTLRPVYPETIQVQPQHLPNIPPTGFPLKQFFSR